MDEGEAMEIGGKNVTGKEGRLRGQRQFLGDVHIWKEKRSYSRISKCILECYKFHACGASFVRCQSQRSERDEG